MLDPQVIELCARCLAGIAAHEGSDDDLGLAATALANDLSATHRADAGALLEAASRGAATHLDDSELDSHAYSVALARLARLRLRVAERLGRGPQTVMPVPSGTP